MKRLALAMLMAGLWVSLLATPASAQDGDGIIIWSGGYRVESGDELDGDLIVFSGDVEVEDGGAVRGNVIALQGNVRVDGRVEGDVVAVLGAVELGPTAIVGGDVTSGAGRVDRAAGAQVAGETVEGGEFPLRPGRFFDFGRIFRGPVFTFGPFSLAAPTAIGGFAELGSALLTLAAVVALAVVAVAFWPKQVRAVGATAMSSAAASLGLGILVGLAAIPALLLLVVLVCTIPLAAVLAVALVGVFLYGWIALGMLVGERVLSSARGGEPSPAAAGALGVALLSLIAAAPCLGFLFSLLAGAWGAGATLLSRFGTRPYPQSAPAPASASPLLGRRAKQ